MSIKILLPCQKKGKGIVLYGTAGGAGEKLNHVYNSELWLLNKLISQALSHELLTLTL